MAPGADGTGYSPLIGALRAAANAPHAAAAATAPRSPYAPAPGGDADGIDHEAQAARAALQEARRGHALYHEQDGFAQAQSQAVARDAIAADPRYAELLDQQRVVADTMRAVVANATDARQKTQATNRRRASARLPEHDLAGAKQVADAGAGGAPQ